LQAGEAGLGADAQKHLAKIHGLGDEVHAASAKTLNFIVGVVERREKDYGCGGCLFVSLQTATGLVTVDARHTHIEQNDVGFAIGDPFERAFAALGHHQLEALGQELLDQQSQIGWVVVHQQNCGFGVVRVHTLTSWGRAIGSSHLMSFCI
jgi:hypothetical protein